MLSPTTHDTLSDEWRRHLEHRLGDVSTGKEVLPAFERARVEPLYLKESGPEFAQGHGVPANRSGARPAKAFTPDYCAPLGSRSSASQSDCKSRSRLAHARPEREYQKSRAEADARLASGVVGVTNKIECESQEGGRFPMRTNRTALDLQRRQKRSSSPWELPRTTASRKG